MVKRSIVDGPLHFQKFKKVTISITYFRCKYMLIHFFLSSLLFFLFFVVFFCCCIFLLLLAEKLMHARV